MRRQGFTLAEVLISLALLAVVAAFAIPKIMQSSQNEQKNSMAKEVAALITTAYQEYRLQNSFGDAPPTNTIGEDLMPYMNYLNRQPTGNIDGRPNLGAPWNCGHVNVICIRLHNKGVLSFHNNSSQNLYSFGGSGPLNAINFMFDPDGSYSGTTTTNPGQAVEFWLYYNGQIRSAGTLKPGTTRADGYSHTFNSTYDPSWFHW